MKILFLANHFDHDTFYSKLKSGEVEDIRNRCLSRCSKNGQRALAREYEISQTAVHYIIKGRNWRHSL